MRSCVRIGLYCKKQFVDGDINDLLSGIDDLLFKKLVFGNMESRYSLSQLIHYITFIKGWKSRQTIMSVSLSRA